MHDYDDHKKAINLSFNLKKGDIKTMLTINAYRIVKESLKHKSHGYT